MQTRKIIVEIICFLFIVLWIPAAMSKLMNFETFRFQLGQSPYIQHVASFTAIAVPVVEIIIALLLVVGRTKLLGLYASFFLMTLFTGYIYAMLHFSYYAPCSCGGILKLFGLEESWNDHLYFNIVFTLLATVAILLWQKEGSKNAAPYYTLKTESYQ